MKTRLLAWASAIALAIAALTPPAHAVTLKTREVGWLYSRAVRESTTAYASNGVSQEAGNFHTQSKRDVQSLPDTTQAFSTAGMLAPPMALVSTASKDTVVIGWLRIFTDSSGTAVTNTLSTIGYTLEGSSDGGTWAAIFTHASNACVASGDQSFIPITIWYNSSLSPGTTGGKPSPLIANPLLRLRITAETGNFFAARVQLVYWGPDQGQ